jgi:hypothetical protein
MLHRLLPTTKNFSIPTDFDLVLGGTLIRDPAALAGKFDFEEADVKDFSVVGSTVYANLAVESYGVNVVAFRANGGDFYLVDNAKKLIAAGDSCFRAIENAKLIHIPACETFGDNVAGDNVFRNINPDCVVTLAAHWENDSENDVNYVKNRCEVIYE